MLGLTWKPQPVGGDPREGRKRFGGCGLRLALVRLSRSEECGIDGQGQPPQAWEIQTQNGLSWIGFSVSMVVRAIYHVGVEEIFGRNPPGAEIKVSEREEEKG